MNPVQFDAAGMDSRLLKQKYGDLLVFWGGGIDTEKVLAFGTPDDVKRQVQKQCEIFRENGGFVFNNAHNFQVNVPVENLVAIVDTLKLIIN